MLLFLRQMSFVVIRTALLLRVYFPHLLHAKARDYMPPAKENALCLKCPQNGDSLATQT
jgi:hypothetical protein